MTRLCGIFKALATALLALALAPVCQAQEPDGKDDAFTVIIDPGHGGKDIGCVGRTAKEKDITLAVAKKLGAKITKKYGDKVRVVYTRDTDRYLTLQERADVANGEHGDLFISIHVNSVDKKNRKRATLSGTSVYTCGLHKTQNNLEVAMMENSVIELEPNYEQVYQEFDPQSDESYIIFEMSQDLNIKQSLQFASLAQKRLVKTAGRVDKEVRQAGFWVLWATSMPAVLVELDFICNPTQEKFLVSAEGQDRCAQALYEAFQDYYGK